MTNKQYTRKYFIYCGHIIITPAQKAAPKSMQQKSKREKKKTKNTPI